MTGAMFGEAAAPHLHVMTLNVRRRLDELAWRRADRWSRRRPRVEALLRRERPTLLGVQEALPDQARAIHKALGDSHGVVGHGRRPGPRGEACPLFFDATRLELLAWRQTALSDDPDKPGSVSWGNLIPRVTVRAEFRDRVTATRFVAVNTHLDPFSRRSREKAARGIRRMLARESHPAILTGDLNAGPESTTVRELLSDGTLTDAWEVAEERRTPAWGTFANYRLPRENGDRIDMILVSPSVRVSRVAVNADTFEGGWASDHLPVQAVLRLPGDEDET